MPIIVEDGRCPQFANSYVSLADADAYLVARGLWPETPLTEAPSVEPEGADEIPELPETQAEEADENEGENANEGDTDKDGDAPESSPIPDAETVAAKEGALIRAFDFLNTLQWKGKKPCWERLPAWPRENVPIPGVYPEEYIDPDLVPQAVKQAQCELAGLIYNGHSLFAPTERGGKVKSVSDSTTESVDVLSQSQSHSVTYADNAPLETWLPSVYPLIEPFLEVVPGQAKCGFTVHGVERG